jgi:hypothetical protein
LSREPWRSVSGDDNVPGCSRSRLPATSSHPLSSSMRCGFVSASR